MDSLLKFSAPTTSASLPWPLATGLVLCTAVPLAVYLLWSYIMLPFRLKLFYGAQGIKGSKFVPLVGDLRRLIAMRKLPDAYDALMRFTMDAGPLSYIFLGPEFRLRIMDPNIVHEILVTHASAFHKPELMRNVLGRAIGIQNLLLSEDDVHRRHRALISPSFSFAKLRGMVAPMGDAARAAVADLQAQCDAAAATGGGSGGGAPLAVDMHVALSAMTLDVIGRAAFGTGGEGDDSASSTDRASRFYRGLNDLLHETTGAIFSLAAFFPLAYKLPTASNRRVAATVRAMNTMLTDIMSNRRKYRASLRSAAAAHGVSKNPFPGSSAAAVGSSSDSNRSRPEALTSTSITGEKHSSVRPDEPTILLDVLLDAGEGPASNSTSVGDDGPDGEATSTSKKNAGRLTDKDILSEAMTFLTAGHETTAQALSWSMYLLATSPEWFEKASEEVLRVLGPHGMPTYDHLAHHLPVTNAIILEAMRLFPPAVLLARTAVRDVVLGAGTKLPHSTASISSSSGGGGDSLFRHRTTDTTSTSDAGRGAPPDSISSTPALYADHPISVKAGTSITIAINCIHRHPALWSRPDEFDPSRFINGITAALAHPMAYLPFSHGIRSCIGQQFALLEGRLLLAVLVQSFTWSLSPEYVHCPEQVITLRPKHGLQLLLRRRTATAI